MKRVSLNGRDWKGGFIDFLCNRTVWILLFGSLAVMGIYQPAFFKIAIIRNILIQASALGIMTIGLAHTLLIGEIDLSIVGVMSFSAGLGVYLMRAEVFPWYVAVLFIIGFGCLIGLINGVIIVLLKAAALIETLAMNLILIGLLLFLTAGRTFSNLPAAYTFIGKKSLYEIPFMTLMLLAVALVVGFVWNKTAFGRSLYAIGGNVTCAKASGINVNAMRIKAFVISSGLCGLAGWVYTAYMGAVPASFAGTYQNYALASAVIGGVSLTGGVGGIGGVLGGVFLISLFNVGLDILGIDPYLVNTVGGGMIMFAVIIDALKNMYKAKH